MPFDDASPPRIFCTACGMPHHEDCYRENGGCTVFGCKCAPADDPKLQVSQSDLSAVSVPVQPYAPFAQRVPQQNASAPQYVNPALYARTHKSRTTYIVLGIFLGAFGVHNFYAGYTGRAVGQLCLTALTLGYLGIVSWVWAIIEICIVEKDSTGLNFS
jgi:TM2 domain-containing membrane protein YozV